jgi:hypothetical protein
MGQYTVGGSAQSSGRTIPPASDVAVQTLDGVITVGQGVRSAESGAFDSITGGVGDATYFLLNGVPRPPGAGLFDQAAPGSSAAVGAASPVPAAPVVLPMWQADP